MIKEFASSERKAALYFVLPEFRAALKELHSMKHPNVKILFPVKSFNDPKILSIVSEFTDGYDVSNANELESVRAFLREGQVVWSSSPYNQLLSEEVQFNDLNSSDGLTELQDFSRVALRLNPSFLKIKNRFGMAKEKVRKALEENAQLSAIHIHLSGIQNTYDDYVNLSHFVSEVIQGLGRKLHLNFGGGVSLLSSDELRAVILHFSELFSDHQIYFEPGRWVAKRCGMALGRVLCVEGKNITTSLSSVCHLRWNDTQFYLSFTTHQNPTGELADYDVLGPTCFESDKIGEIKTSEGVIKPGQFVLVNHVSGYSYGWNHSFNGVDAADIVYLGN